jgi:hypothetical protein
VSRGAFVGSQRLPIAPVDPAESGRGILHDGARGDRLEAAGIALSVREVARLAQVQEPERAGGAARSGGGLALMGRQPARESHRNVLTPRSRAAARPDSALASAAPRRMMPAMADLLLRRAPAAPGEVYDVLGGSRIVGRNLLSDASAASQWVWTLSYDYHEDRTPTHGYAATRDAALQALARSWNRET